MDRVAGLGIRSVHEHGDSGRSSKNESLGLQRQDGPRKIRFIENDVNITGITDNRLVDLGNPVLNGIAADHCIGNLRGIESPGHSSQTILHFFHSPLNPFPQGVASVFDLYHLRSSQRMFNESTHPWRMACCLPVNVGESHLGMAWHG